MSDISKRRRLSRCVLGFVGFLCPVELQLPEPDTIMNGSDNWAFLLYELFTGPKTFNSRLDIFGCHVAGIAIISEFLMRPSLRPESYLRFHLAYGQLLQIPVTEDGWIAATPNRYFMERRPQKIHDSGHPINQLVRSESPDKLVRIDLEPNWAFDPRTVVFCFRIHGLVRYRFSPSLLRWERDVEYPGAAKIHFVSCSCETPVTEIDWPNVVLKLSTMLSSKLYCDSANYETTDDRGYFVNAAGDEPAQLICRLLFRPRPYQHVVFAQGCLKCARDLLRQLFDSKQACLSRDVDLVPEGKRKRVSIRQISSNAIEAGISEQMAEENSQVAESTIDTVESEDDLIPPYWSRFVVLVDAIQN